jgi:hypothetical protein
MDADDIKGPLFAASVKEDNPVQIEIDPDFGDLNPSITRLKVGRIITQLLTQRYRITWPQIVGADHYRLYGSISPGRQGNLLQDNLTDTETHFVPPVFTPVIQYYFWVSVVLVNGREEYLSDVPASLETTARKKAFEGSPITDAAPIIADSEGLNAEMPEIYDYIRFGDRLQIENDGENALLFQMRHGEDKPFGVPCECTDSTDGENDPDYSGRGRCGLCYGTGIWGGYYPAIPIRIRYMGMPSQRFIRNPTGFTTEHVFNTITIWDPQIRVGDLVLRLSDGNRYHVADRSESSARAIRLHQAFDLEQVPGTDIRNYVTDTGIKHALKQLEAPGYVRDGFLAFG